MLRTLRTTTALVLLCTSVPAQMTQFCRPGIDAGVMACPCGNPPAGGGFGCNNFGAGPAQSGTLDASGSPAADSVILNATGLNNVALTIFIQSRSPTSPAGLVYGAGVRCVASGAGTFFKRMYTGSSSAGMISRPGINDPSI